MADPLSLQSAVLVSLGWGSQKTCGWSLAVCVWMTQWALTRYSVCWPVSFLWMPGCLSWTVLCPHNLTHIILLLLFTSQSKVSAVSFIYHLPLLLSCSNMIHFTDSHFPLDTIPCYNHNYCTYVHTLMSVILILIIVSFFSFHFFLSNSIPYHPRDHENRFGTAGHRQTGLVTLDSVTLHSPRFDLVSSLYDPPFGRYSQLL